MLTFCFVLNKLYNNVFVRETSVRYNCKPSIHGSSRTLSQKFIYDNVIFCKWQSFGRDGNSAEASVE
jgi:hypothetical protein